MRSLKASNVGVRNSRYPGQRQRVRTSVTPTPSAKRAGEPWSSEDDQQLRIAMLQGRTARGIAIQVQRTTRAVRRRAEILKLSWLASRKG
jgi:hypothetical protein